MRGYRVLVAFLLLLCLCGLAQAQMLINSNIVLPDGSTMSVQLQKNAVQLQNGDAFNVFISWGDPAPQPAPPPPPPSGTQQTNSTSSWVEEVFPINNAPLTKADMIRISMLSAYAVAIGVVSIDQAIAAGKQLGVQITFQQSSTPPTLTNSTIQAMTSSLLSTSNLAAGPDTEQIMLSLLQALSLQDPCANAVLIP